MIKNNRDISLTEEESDEFIITEFGAQAQIGKTVVRIHYNDESSLTLEKAISQWLINRKNEIFP